MSKAKLFTVILVIVMLASVNVYSQAKCLFICSTIPMDVPDNTLYEKLVDWGYDIDAITSGDLTIMFPEEFDPYDFIFVSETIGSGDLNPIKTIPVPMVLSEGWAVKPTALDWQTDRDVNNYDPEDVKIVDDTGHTLAAGFSTGAMVTLVTEGFVIGSVPQIPIIPIAVLSSDNTKQVIYGIEAGTPNALGDIIESKVAVIGIHAEGYHTLTEDAWKFFEAGINWVLDETSVEGQDQISATGFELIQNFPNPFNPVTRIQYTLNKNTTVEMAVYDLLGHKITTLVNEYQNVGNHQVVWDASEASAGIYICQMRTIDFAESKKMILSK